MDNAQVTQKSSRASRYLSDQKAAQENLATYPESTRQRLRAWQTKQSEWFDNVILEIVSEFIAVDDALRAERSEPVGWMGIESAPRDGTFIDVWVDGEYPGRRTDVSWRKPTDSEWWVHGGETIETLDATWHDSFGPLSGCEQPTHWMPLPSAPGTTPPEPVAEIERLREALKRLSDERTLQTTIPEGPWTPEMVAEFQSKEVGHMRDLARAALGDAS